MSLLGGLSSLRKWGDSVPGFFCVWGVSQIPWVLEQKWNFGEGERGRMEGGKGKGGGWKGEKGKGEDCPFSILSDTTISWGVLGMYPLDMGQPAKMSALSRGQGLFCERAWSVEAGRARHLSLSAVRKRGRFQPMRSDLGYLISISSIQERRYACGYSTGARSAPEPRTAKPSLAQPHT